ncbi:MAG: TIGR01777 family oxidoreductase [Phycisphaerales bacterium]|nr:TIGR01777 family oxidoreductase [Phycisphaerales bacterium]
MLGTIVIAGGSGFIGSYVASYFHQKGYKIVILTRYPHRLNHSNYTWVYWNSQTSDNWKGFLEDSVAVINLTGKSINCIYHRFNKKKIIDSRTHSTDLLCRVINELSRPPKMFIQISAVGIYGDTRVSCNETAAVGYDFLASVCEQWEASFLKIHLPNTKKTILRLGLPFAPTAGYLPPLIKLNKYFLGFSLGKPAPSISWIHIDDLMQVFEFILLNSLEGVYNVASPNAITQKQLTDTLSKLLKRPILPSLPNWTVKILCYTQGVDPTLVLSSSNAYPQNLLDAGFIFQYDQVELALQNILEIGW